MPVAACSVESRAAWFAMIIGYLKVKSLALWFNAHPESCYECFEEAWPFMLDEMMRAATLTAIEQLQTTVQSSLN